MALTRVELEQFTAFATLKLDLCRGINVLIGANGTGKTHLMKVCYAACDGSRSPADDFIRKLVRVFMPSGRNLRRLVRQQGGADGEAAIRVWRGALKLEAEQQLPLWGPQGPDRRPWVRPIVHSCGVFNIASWNRNLPEHPVRRVATPARDG